MHITSVTHRQENEKIKDTLTYYPRKIKMGNWLTFRNNRDISYTSLFSSVQCFCIGNHMISSASWNKEARVIFSKTNKSARARRASVLCGLWKIYKCLFIPNCTRKIMWLLINNIHEKNNYNKKIWQGALFLVHSTDWLKQITTFVKCKVLQDWHVQNHSN